MPRTKQFDEAEVLQKAKELFWKQGYHATSIGDLVEHLGINRASLYDTFGGKNQLYEAALRSYRDESMAFLQKRMAGFKSAKTGIKTLFREAMKESINDPDCKGCFVINCTSEYLPLHEHFLAELLENKANFQKVMEKTLKRGKENGEFPSGMSVRDTAAYLYSLFSGLKITATLQQDKKELFKSIDLGLKVLEQ